MPAPKGMRVVPVAISETDAIHIYSDDGHIWLQLRRHVPTSKTITTTSFKATLTLTPEQATRVGDELLALAKRTAQSNGAEKASPTPRSVSLKPVGK